MDPKAFTPKQAFAFGPEWLDLIQGTIASDVAQRAVSLASPITPTSIVHDNACGTGTVTSLVASASTKPSKIHATDLFHALTAVVQEKATKNSWGFVEAVPMDSLNLVDLADNTFTHSFSNLILQGVTDPGKATSEVYRTVKPGGTAIFTTMGAAIHESAIDFASEATRGKQVTLRVPCYQDKTSKEWLEKQLKDAGFKNVEVSRHVENWDVESLADWCSQMWSVMGMPAAGWTQEDEESWDKAIELMVEDLKKKEEVEARANGSVRFRLPANIAVATK